MAYSKQTWTDGVAGGTPVTAARLAHMEDGVAAAAVVADLGTPGTPTGDAAKAAFVPVGDLLRFTPSSLPNWRRAMARVRTGTADAKILCVGDSTTAGVGANGDTTVGGLMSYPAQLAGLLNVSGIAAARGLGIPSPANDDARWTTTGAGWSKPNGLGWATIALYQWSGSTVSNLVYTDAGTTADRFDVYYITAGGAGSFTATATGGSGVVQSLDASPGVGKVTASAASAATTNTLTITPSNNGTIWILGVEPWLSTTKRVRVGNAGVGSTQAYHWATDGIGASWNSQNCIRAYAPDLTIISLGLNDGMDSRTTDQFVGYITTIATAAQASGDVVLMPPVPPRSSANALVLAAVPGYTAGMKGIQLPYADLNNRWTSGDVESGLGFYWDALHPSAQGYADIAQMLGKALRGI